MYNNPYNKPDGTAVLGQAQILEGRTLAKELRQQLKLEVAEFSHQYKIQPSLMVLLVGNDPSSAAYTKTLTKAAADLGFAANSLILPSDTSLTQLQANLAKLNNDPEVHGITVQWPLPAHLTFEAVTQALDPRKDVDGYNPTLLGRLYCGLDTFVPATPLGGMKLLDYYNLNVSGKNCLLIGYGVTVGRPLFGLLMAAKASVMVATVTTPPSVLKDYARQADFIFAAAGVPKLVTSDMVKPDAVVIDFGTSLVDDKLVGDADYEALLPIVKAITPTPGGTGPVTNVVLLGNVLKAARQQTKLT